MPAQPTVATDDRPIPPGARRQTVLVGKCPRCGVHVETDIHPLACAEHRDQVENANRARLGSLRARQAERSAS